MQLHNKFLTLIALQFPDSLLFIYYILFINYINHKEKKIILKTKRKEKKNQYTETAIYINLL